MASLQQDPSGNWHIHFRFGGKRFKRSLQTKKESEAKPLYGGVGDIILLVNRGAKVMPAGADVFLFSLSDGKVERPIELPDRLTMEQLFNEFEKAVTNRLEETTLYTIGVHTRQLQRILGEKLDPRGLALKQLDPYVRTRQGEKTKRGNKVSAATVRKEIGSLSATWGGLRTGTSWGRCPTREGSPTPRSPKGRIVGVGNHSLFQGGFRQRCPGIDANPHRDLQHL